MVEDELAACKDEEKVGWLKSKSKTVIFTFDMADQSMDKLVEAMNFKNEETKKDLLRQAELQQVRAQAR